MQLLRVSLIVACTAFSVAACGDDPTGSGDTSNTTDATTTPDGTDATTTTPDGSDATTTTPDGSDATVLTDATTTPDGTDATTTTDSTTSPDTDTVEPPPSCEDPIPAAPEGQVCGVVPGSDAALLIRADLVLPEGIQEQGQVLVENGMITCVGCDCASKPAAATATVFNCPEGVVSPGLINAHDHITYDQGKPIDIGTTRYDHRNEWRNGMNGKPEIPYDTNPDPGGTAWSEMRQVMAGTTSIFASGGSFGMLRNLDVANKLEGLTHGTADYDVFPLGSSGIYNSGCDKYSLPAATIADGKVAYVPHVSEGVSVGARNEFICLDGQQDGGVDIVGENVGFIHGVGTTAADIGIFVGENAKLVWSPRSNTVLYGFTAYAPIYHKMGGQVALGTDWTFSGSATILRELRCAQDWNERWDNYFSDQQLVNMVTSWAASALGFGDVLGSLTVNKVADIAIWDARVHTGYRAILDATDGDVVLAMRGGPPPSIGGTTYYRRGRPLIGEPALVAELSDRQLNYASYDPAIYSATDNSKKKLPPPCEDVTVCGKTKSFCVAEQLETKPSGSSFFTTQTLAELRATLNASYTLDLFVCDAPADEPTCVPFRPGEFDGTTSANDPDGDNLVGVDDNCPDWFNAIRPMDGGKQPDTDGDGLGDVCDPCPLQANTTACESVNPDDIDGDSVLNDSDNCPSDANPGQEDRDHDNIGDLCDACPDDSNEGGKACPSTISQVKQDAALKGSDVFLPGVMCVSAGKDFFTVQTKGATTPDFNGLYVFAGASGLKCTPGDTIDLQGHIEDFHGQTEMTSPTFVTTAGTTNGPVPDPFVVNAADIGATGTKIFEYEALLVTVQNVSVTSITPTPATGETVSGEFVVTGGLSVDDQIFLITPFPAVGDAFPAITGVTRYTWNRIKLLPRSVDDYSSGPPALAAIEPATGSMYAGDVGGPFQVRLTGKAQGATVVHVTSSDTGVATVVDVTVADGQKTAPIVVTAKAEGSAVLTATLVSGGDPQTAILDVVPAGTIPSVVSVDAQDTVTIGEDFDVTVTLDLPAPTGGQIVTLAADPTGLVTLPGTVTVLAGATTATVSATAGGTAGEVDITASTTSGEATVTVTLSDAPPPAEVVFCFEDSAGTYSLAPNLDSHTTSPSVFVTGAGVGAPTSVSGSTAARPAVCTGANNSALNGNDWPLTAGIGATKFYQVTINHGSGNYTLTFDLRASNTGPKQLDVVSSTSGALVTAGVIATDAAFHTVTWTGTLTGGADAIKIYGSAAGGAGGTLRIDNIHLAPAP